MINQQLQNAINLLRYQYAASVGYYVTRKNGLTLLAQQKPTLQQLAFLTSLNDLYKAQTPAGLKAAAMLANSAWRVAPMDKAMNIAWVKIYAEINRV